MLKENEKMLKSLDKLYEEVDKRENEKEMTLETNQRDIKRLKKKQEELRKLKQVENPSCFLTFSNRFWNSKPLTSAQGLQKKSTFSKKQKRKESLSSKSCDTVVSKIT